MGPTASRLWNRTPRRQTFLIPSLLIAAIGLTACLGQSYAYVSHPATNTFLRVPSSWKVYTEDDVVRSKASGLTPAQQAGLKKQLWQIDFDASPQPSIDHVFSPLADHPAGLVRVRNLTNAEQDAVSIGSLRTELLANDPLASSTSTDPSQQVVSYNEVSRPGGYRGSHLVLSVKLTDGGKVIIDQMGFIDPKGGHVYLLAFSCSSTCYNTNHATIDRIFGSWILKGHT